MNGAVFFDLPYTRMVTAVAHEIGHAAIAALDEMMADRLVCKWGLLSELKEERRISYGESYCQILDVWEDEAAFYDRMQAWEYERTVNRLLGHQTS